MQAVIKTTQIATSLVRKDRILSSWSLSFHKFRVVLKITKDAKIKISPRIEHNNASIFSRMLPHESPKRIEVNARLITPNNNTPQKICDLMNWSTSLASIAMKLLCNGGRGPFVIR